MSFRSIQEILAEATARSMRRALLVTALPIEMRAVRAHLTNLGSCAGRDGTIYECGVFSGTTEEWLVVVVETGAGTHPAQSVVTYAHTMFGPFEIQIFVGVGGSRKSDAPLGCVVASDHVYMPYSGKYGEKGWSSRPRTFQIDNRVVGLARKVSRDEEWPARILPPLKGRLPGLDVYPVTYPPRAVIAAIVSVEAVSANPASLLETHIAENYGDACVVEMEGYGAIFAANQERTPSILIRGISDMTGADKTAEDDAKRQPIAACHAAAFGFELLSAWGEVYRLPTPPPTSGPAQSPPLAISGEASTDAIPVQPRATARLVLNLDGSQEDYPPERVQALLDALRRVAGSTEITIVGSEKGSLRLIVEGPSDALDKVDVNKLRAALAEQEEVSLLGIVSEIEYEGLKGLQMELEPASRDLLAWPQTLPGGGEWIDRPELGQLLSLLLERASSTTAVVGLPGAGKSALMAALGHAMLERGWPVLAIKADLLDPGVTTEANLQARLSLSEKPSVILERLAKLRPVVLLIDQLDALAGYLDVSTGRLSVLLNLVRRLGRIENVHIVLSARAFEYEHDVRLRVISAESLSLELPAWSQILAVLEGKGIRAAGWPADAQEVMRSPQALATYLQLEGRAESEPFVTYQAMLERLWSERILAGEQGARRAQLAYDIADRMAEEESLWLASARFDSQRTDVDTLIALGVLTTYGSGGSIGFTHQTLLDFALARGFAQSRGRLSRYVLERQTSLFLRPKLWAALSYLRAVERPTYEVELETIWLSPGLRRHLWHLLIDFIGQQSAPTDREALLMEKALQQPENRALGFRALTGSAGWFQRFANGFIANAMSEAGSVADLTVGVLIPAWSFAADTVAQLIASRWAPDPTNDGRAWTVIASCPEWTDAVLDLAIKIVRRTEIAPFHINFTISTIGVGQPQMALRLARARLDREIAIAQKHAAELAQEPKPELEDPGAAMAWDLRQNPRGSLRQLIDNNDWDALPALAEKSPNGFLDELWAWYLELFETLRHYEGPCEGLLGYALSYDGDYRFEGEHSLGLPEPALLAAVRTAVEGFAAVNPDAFMAWMKQQETVDATPVHRLFAHTLASHPETFAQRALDYLLEDPRRFHLGSIEDSMSTTKRLIEAVSPYWLEADIARFEATVAQYAPPPRPGLEDPAARRSWRHIVRRVQLGLLRALPRHRTSAAIRRKIAEESRVFPDGRLGVQFSGARIIGSIMSADAISRASDDDVIKAFQTLPDATEWSHPTDWEKGGNIQLAREFASFAKTEPERARRLIARFQPDFGARAAGNALMAMAETGDAEAITRLFLDLAARGFDGEEYRGSAARAVEGLANRGCHIGAEVADVLERWLATPVPPTSADEVVAPSQDDEAPIDPGVQSDRDAGGITKQDANVHSVVWDSGGISFLPGGQYPLLEALICVRLARKEPERLIETLFDSLSRMDDPKIWQALLNIFVYLQPGEHDRRAEFLTTVFDRFPELIGTTEAARLLAQVHWWAPDMVRRQLERWRRVSDAHVLQAYGELVALVAIQQPDVPWPHALLEEIEGVENLVHARVGAAFSAVNVWTELKFRETATGLISRLLKRRERGVWIAVFDLFRLVGELTPEPQTVILVEVIAEHMAFAPPLGGTFVVEQLATLLPHQAPLVARIAQGLVNLWKDELADIRTSIAATAPQLVDLAVTLHRLGPETREMGTSLFEQLVEMDAYLARQTLDEIDSRFRSERRVARRHLPRWSIHRPGRARLVT